MPYFLGKIVKPLAFVGNLWLWRSNKRLANACFSTKKNKAKYMCCVSIKVHAYFITTPNFEPMHTSTIYSYNPLGTICNIMPKKSLRT